MKVAILTRDYPPAIGGIATHVEGLVKALRARGVDVDVYVGSNEPKTLLLPFDIPLKSYDLVHVQSAPYGAFVTGVPFVVTVHSPVLEEFTHYRSLLKAAAIPAIGLERASLRRAKAVLAVSAQSRKELLEMYRLPVSKVGVIGNGVDYQRFSEAGSRRGPTSSKRVIVVSRLERRKNVREAIESVAALPAGSCQLDIVGDGTEMGELSGLVDRLRARDYIHLLGRVNGGSLPELYSSAGIFMTTSASEGFGLSLLEAMSSGCACVVSDLPTHRALISDGVNGLVYKTASELVACLSDLLSSPEKMRRLGDAARASASEHTWDRVAERVSTVYQWVGKKPPN